MTAVEVENLSKSYGDITALAGFTFAVSPGEIFALVGPDGAGKTSLMRILCSLTGPDTGRVRIGGADVLTEFERIKPALGYMPQVFSLYPDLSVEENLVFYAGIYDVVGREYRDRRERMYEFSRLKPFAGRRSGDLSGGMKQKLALSCALMHDPQVLLLDEPTTGVDPLSRRQFWDILLDLKRQGVTIVVTTPYMDEVARADRACFIFAGSKLAEGTPEELQRQYEGRVFYAEIKPDVTLLDRLNSVRGLRAHRSGSGVHLYLSREDSIENHADDLSGLGIDRHRIKPVEPDLEDRFIQLMGEAS